MKDRMCFVVGNENQTINIPPLGVSQTTMIPAVCSRPSSSQKQKMCFALFRIELKPPREDCP